jgi:hypothetical protein
MTDLHLLHEAESLVGEAEELRKRFLRNHGWKETSAVPGSYWVWQKVDDKGVLMSVPINVAIGMQTCGYGFADSTPHSDD